MIARAQACYVCVCTYINTSTIFCALPPHYWAERRIKNNNSACIGAWFIISFVGARERRFFANTGGFWLCAVRSLCVCVCCKKAARVAWWCARGFCRRWMRGGARRHYFRIWKRVGCTQINNHVVCLRANDFICFCLRYCLYWWNLPERANIVRKHAVRAVFCSCLHKTGRTMAQINKYIKHSDLGFNSTQTEQNCISFIDH